MSSKQLQSILKNIPSATAQGEKNNETIPAQEVQHLITAPLNNVIIERKTERLVAEIPQSLKKQIKVYIANNPGITEKGVILKALKAYGFDIEDTLFIDKRTTR